MYIYSYNAGSESAKALKDALGIKKIKNENSNFKGKPTKIVLNWGSSEVPPEILKCRILNKPEAVKICSNKLNFFKHIYDPIDNEWMPDFTTSMDQAIEWCGAKFTVLARTVLNGHSGAGIVIMNDPDTFVKAPLYVKYVPKTEEYRVHVFRNKVIDIQRKTLSKEKLQEKNIPIEDVNWKIRNLDNCFIYQRANVNPPDSVLEVSRRVVSLCGLDFGAVDIIVGKKDNKPYVLEVNSAPGLQGTTLENYVSVLKDIK